MVVIGTILGVVLMYGGLHLFGGAMLALTYSAKAEFNQYKVPKLFAAKWIVLTGLPGFITSGDEENGLFWRHIRGRMDADRTNAYDIAECKANLRRLRNLPRTSTTLKALGAEERRLVTLRAHDNEVASAIGVSVLAPDLAATRASVRASQGTLDALHHPSDS